MGWIGPAIGAVASIVGGEMGQQNNAATNAANANLNQANMNWQTQMSDTAMTRRVADLKNAGLNPLLAVSQGGASTPGFAPIAMQSSNSLGQGVSQAAQSAAQVANLQADTRKKNADAAATEASTPDDPAATRSRATDMSLAQLSQVWRQVGVADETIDNLRANTAVGQQQLANLKAQLPGIQANSQIGEMDASTQKQLMPGLIKVALAEQAAAGTSAQNVAKFQSSKWGQLLNSVGLGPGGRGDSAAGVVTNAAKVGAAFVP